MKQSVSLELCLFCCSHGSFASGMSQYTELGELEAVRPTQELLSAIESVDVSECLGDEFDKRARFQKPTTVNEIEQRERDRRKARKKHLENHQQPHLFVIKHGETTLSFNFSQKLLSRIWFCYFDG